MSDPLALSYNERLFRPGSIRSSYHVARYRWLAKQLSSLGSNLRIVEIGCFDAKTLNFIPEPAYYLGLDAGGEDGLSQGQTRFANRRNVELSLCCRPEEMPDRGIFDAAV